MMNTFTFQLIIVVLGYVVVLGLGILPIAVAKYTGMAMMMPILYGIEIVIVGMFAWILRSVEQ